jgi:hypothetical protein
MMGAPFPSLLFYATTRRLYETSECQYISFSPSTSYILGILARLMRRWTPMTLGIAACFGYLA